MALELKSYLDRILETVPPDQREKVRSEYSKMQDAVRQAESTLESETAQVRQLAAQQKAWWETNEPKVHQFDQVAAERDRYKAAAERPGGIDTAEIDKRLNALRNEVIETGLGMVTNIPNIQMRHFQEFGEVLDVRKLTEEAIKANTPIDQYYAASVAERRATRATEQRAKEIAEAEERGAKRATEEFIKKAGSSMPYPVGQTAPVTTLAGLQKPAEGQVSPFSLAAAVATANEVAARQQ